MHVLVEMFSITYNFSFIRQCIFIWLISSGREIFHLLKYPGKFLIFERTTKIWAQVRDWPQSPSWQRALRYAPAFPLCNRPNFKILENHKEGFIKHIIINHTLSYDNITLSLFHSLLICENSANNRVVITWIICCGWTRNLV